MEVLKIHNYASCTLDDSSIVHRIVAGEKELFEILLRRHNQRLFRIIRSYLKDSDEVQDAMQNAYLKAFDKLHQFQGSSSFSTWLIRIGINEALQRLKNIKREKVIYLNPHDVGEGLLNQIQDKQIGPEKKMMQQEGKQLLEKAIDNLPEKYRVVYMLKEVEGLPTEEVCESLGLTESNVKVRLHRAKSLLKESLFQLSSTSDVFEFGNTRCDAVVKFVMNAI
jgi:RNA polymerase sigma factor (sigma-70 family)